MAARPGWTPSSQGKVDNMLAPVAGVTTTDADVQRWEMPTNAKSYAVDTSVALAALDSAHAAHAGSLAAVRAHRPALAGHAAFETFSVLTRMPGYLAVAAPTAVAIIERVFPEIHLFTPKNALALLAPSGGEVVARNRPVGLRLSRQLDHQNAARVGLLVS